MKPLKHDQRDSECQPLRDIDFVTNRGDRAKDEKCCGHKDHHNEHDVGDFSDEKSIKIEPVDEDFARYAFHGLKPPTLYTDYMENSKRSGVMTTDTDLELDRVCRNLKKEFHEVRGESCDSLRTQTSAVTTNRNMEYNQLTQHTECVPPSVAAGLEIPFGPQDDVPDVPPAIGLDGWNEVGVPNGLRDEEMTDLLDQLLGQQCIPPLPGLPSLDPQIPIPHFSVPDLPPFYGLNERDNFLNLPNILTVYRFQHLKRLLRTLLFHHQNKQKLN